MRYLVIPLLAFGLIFPNLSEAQLWKQMRYEAIYGLGATNFLGDLGGADQIGTNQFKDLEYSLTRSVISGGVRYRLLEWLSVKGSLQLGMVRGDDKLTKDPSRSYRNLSFRSPIYEFAVVIEAALLKEHIVRFTI